MGLDITFIVVDKTEIKQPVSNKDTSIFEWEPERLRDFIKTTPSAKRCYLIKEHRAKLEDPLHKLVLELFGFFDKGCGWVLSLDDLMMLLKTINTRVCADTNHEVFSSKRVVETISDLNEIIDVTDFDTQWVLYSWC